MIPDRKHDITRIEAFSDGMIAFAATLLVVSLEAPKNYGDLITTLYGFVPFGLSFAGLLFIWVVHTTLFRQYPLSDQLSIYINGVLLFTVLFYVQPLRFLASSFVSMFSNRAGTSAVQSWAQLQDLFIIYALGWIMIFVLVAWLYQRAHATRDRLGLTPVQAYDAMTQSYKYLGFAAAGVVSILLGLTGLGLSFGLPGFGYATIGLFVWLVFRQREPGRARLAAIVGDHPQLADTLNLSQAAIREALKNE